MHDASDNITVARNVQAGYILLASAKGAGRSNVLSPPTACLSARAAAAESAWATEVPLAACAAAVDGITTLVSPRLSGTAATASAGLLEAGDRLLEAPLLLPVALVCGVRAVWGNADFADFVDVFATFWDAPFEPALGFVFPFLLV